MRKLLLALTLFFIVQQFSFSQWQTYDLGIEDFSENLYDVFFVNDNIGWIVGNNTILKTTDGGDNWIQQTPAVANTRFYGVYFKDENNGWAVGKSVTGTAGRIHYTIDGGDNWLVYYTSGSLPWWSIDFADVNNGVIVGQEGQILYTNDGGQNWFLRNSPAGDAGTIYDISFYDNTNGIAVGGAGGNGFIIKTNDAGNSWANVETTNLPDTIGNLRAVSFLGSDNGIAAGANGNIYTTYNGGNSWFLQDSGPSVGYLQSVHHINSDDVITVGSTGTILSSNTAGTFWSQQELESTPYLRGVSFNNPNSGWAVGSFGVILRYKRDSFLKVFNEIEKYGSTNPLRTELDYFLLNVSADGSSATTFENHGFNHQNQTFKILEDLNATDTNKYGSFEIIESSEDSTAIRYNHPKYLDLNNEQSMTIHVGIFDEGASEANFEFPISIVKPPILMVHGLWSNGNDAFGKFRSELLTSGMYLPYQIALVNYKNDAFVFENAPTLNFAKNNLKYQCTRNNNSVGKIDLFGHSMGGLVSRYYIQSEQYENDVNKLITFNTPHSGSQWADLILDPQFYFLPQILSDLNHNPTNGAIDNLRTQGSFINSLNNSSDSDNYSDIGLHSIVTTETITGLGLEYTKVIGFAMAAQTQIVDFNMKHFLFNDEINDLIVPFSSQVGGVEFSSYTSQWHSSTGDLLQGGNPNPNVLIKAKELVNKDPEDVAFFDNFGYNPVELDYTLNYQRPINNYSNESLAITNPIEESTYISGSDVTIEVNGSSGITNILTSMGSQNTSIQSDLSENSLATMVYTIPENFLGRLEIVAMGFDSNGYADYDSTYILVTTTATLQSIEIDEDLIYVAENNSTPIRILGNYSDGVQRDISKLVDISYGFNNNNASNIEPGFINGITEGDDILTVTLDDKIDSVPVIISPSSEIYDITLTDSEVVVNENILSIYPNPTSNFLIVKTIDGIDNISIFDLTGKLLISQENSKSIDVTKLANGIYIAQIMIKNRIVSKQFVKK